MLASLHLRHQSSRSLSRCWTLSEAPSILRFVLFTVLPALLFLLRLVTTIRHFLETLILVHIFSLVRTGFSQKWETRTLLPSIELLDCPCN